MSDDVKEKIFLGFGILYVIGFFILMTILG